MTLPKYKFLAQTLRKELLGGVYHSGDALPTEQTLARSYACSRQTVRQAIALLENEGLIVRRQGSGTYAAPPPAPAARSVHVITTYITDYIFPFIVRGIERSLSAASCRMTLSATYNHVEQERMLLKQILDAPPDGLIIEGTKTALDNPNLFLYQEIARRGIPCVFINGVYPQLEGAVSVLMDDREGGRMAARYLVQHGAKRLAGIFKSDDLQGVLRCEGFTQEAAALGMPVDKKDLVFFSTETKTALIAGGAGIPPCEKGLGLCCYNDEIALRAVRSWAAAGEYDSHQLVSFDQSALAQLSTPPLHSLGHAKEALGQQAAQKLLSLIARNSEQSVSLPWTPIANEEEDK